MGSDKVLAETWMPEFSGDLYGKRVRVFLLEFLRPERKFASLEELKAAITYNGRQAQAVAARTPPPAFPASGGKRAVLPGFSRDISRKPLYKNRALW